MDRHCLLLSVATAVLVLVAVELAMRVPGQQHLVALVAAIVIGAVTWRVLAGIVVGPLRGREAALREKARAAGQAQERLAALVATTSSLRHDLRGILSPSLMMADRLLDHEDPKVRRAGEVMVQTVERCSERLAQTHAGPPA